MPIVSTRGRRSDEPSYAPNPIRLEIENRPNVPDALAAMTARQISAWLGLSPTRVRTRKVFLCDLDITEDEARVVLGAIADPVIEVAAVGALSDPIEPEAPEILTVSFLPGVTDAVGKSVKTACEDALGRTLLGHVHTATMFLFWGLSEADVLRAAAEVLHNPLIQRVRLEKPPRAVDLAIPRAGTTTPPSVEIVPLRGLSDDALQQLSNDRLLALSVEEMRAAVAYFDAEGRDPTDAELECIAQTWSEHCKHKIFNAPIEYTDPEGQTRLIERGVFKTYVVAATDAVREAREKSGIDGEAGAFLVSVFSDNAGVVRFTEADHLVYKVETHNSPSALDPYGGAMTGIVGVNRDSFGCGLGADLVANVWGYCFGRPDQEAPMPKGLMHPRRIRDGVHRGVIDGGNQSGIPYMRGFELFDDRYAGKPLVYCGTVAAMPVTIAGKEAHLKYTQAGDRIVMIGGRVGKDGIHGATFSSVELNESSPVQAVQIGDPITQKMMFDMLTEARDAGLYSGITDNGAGGLSSSVGEMAEASNGAEIDLAKVPLKYPGLEPWEILVSEAQERMTVAVPPDKLEAFMELAARREVLATDIGVFTSTGRLVVRYGRGAEVADLSLAFLHGGLPKTVRKARWSPPPREILGEDERAKLLGSVSIEDAMTNMLRRPNQRSGERYTRHYDHEVKGLAVVKPNVGVRRDIPATATVMRVRHERDEGVVLGEGIHPHYSDLDTREMALACADEGVRRVIAAGARLDRMAALDNFCWPDPIESASTPDGAHKLAQLVRACEGLFDACVAYGLPLVSGKDSMKNDAKLGGVKISVPPTLLVSVMGQMPDVRRALTLTPRAPGDLLYMLGETADELGGSELERMLGRPLGAAPKTDLLRFAARYQAFCEARDAGLVRSAHVTSRGGLAMALAHLAMAGELGVSVVLASTNLLSAAILLFSESTGRILFTASPKDASALEARLGPHGLVRLGAIEAPREGRGFVCVREGSRVLADVGTSELRRAFQEENDAV